ncbi:MAG: LPS-assembly protein LptD [Deltaproteobacteria bacterium]|nr:LPS-assembly protein LptD [Deltaproteobacteria bacterium]
MNRFFILLSFVLTLCSNRETRAEGRPHLKLSHEISLHARHLVLEPNTERIVAKGQCKLEAGDLVIEASSLILNIPTGIAELHLPTVLGPDGTVLTGSHLLLNIENETLELEEPRLRLPHTGDTETIIAGEKAHCAKGTCSLVEATSTTCPHEPVGYRIHAREILVHKSGDIDLTWPVLEVSETPVLAFPWIRLRPPGEAGFLPPRLGWDAKGGFVAGPAGYIPLGSNASADGHVAIRTAQGLESRTRLNAPNLDLTLDHLFDVPDNSVRIRGRTAALLRGVSVAASIDIATDRDIIDDLAKYPMERAITHTVSRGLLSTEIGGFVFETYAEMLQSFDERGRITEDLLTPRASVELALPASPIARYFWPSLDLKFTRAGISSSSLMPDAVQALMPGHSRLDLSYGLDLPGRLGPLHSEIRMAGRHQAWLPDKVSESGSTVHLGSAEARLGLPLIRRFDSVRHAVEPFAVYRLTPWLEGSTPDWVVDDLDRLRRGQGMEMGIATRFDSRSMRPAVRLEIKERFDLPGFDTMSGPAYVAASGIAGPRWLTLTIDGSWDHTQSRPSTAGLSLASRHGEGNRIELGGRWIGPGRGPHRDQPFKGASGPSLTALWPVWIGNRMEVFEELGVALTRRLSAFAGVRVGVWPNRALHALLYGLDLHSFCGCIVAGIVASHRLNTPVPDVMATLRLVGM